MLFVLAAMLLDPPRSAEAPPNALTVRLVRPRAQGERVIALFEGARARDPAAALAGYKRAKGGDTGLGKPIDAAIAAINPAMVAELATLDDATIAVGPSPEGKITWNAVVPRDDGTFAAYATAAALTGGASVEPMDGLPVDRLGPRPDASLASRAPGGFLIARTRAGLVDALRRSREPMPAPAIDSGWLLHIDPAALGVGPLPIRRAGAALANLGCSGLDGSARLDGETLRAEVVGHYAAPVALARATIRPGWLDAVPAEGTLAAIAVALDPDPRAWASTFDLLGAVERADPSRANLAPLRLRLNLLARAAVVQPDIDLWPRLLGVSAIVGSDGVLVRLHARDEASARRLETLTLLRIARAVAGVKADDPEAVIQVRGRALTIARRGDDVALAWGDAILARTTEAASDPARSAGPRLREALGPGAQRFAAAWPGRLPSLDCPDAPPAVWVGRFEGSTSVDRLDWPGLKGVVRRVVDRLPYDPPPDAATPTRAR